MSFLQKQNNKIRLLDQWHSCPLGLSFALGMAVILPLSLSVLFHLVKILPGLFLLLAACLFGVGRFCSSCFHPGILLVAHFILECFPFLEDLHTAAPSLASSALHLECYYFAYPQTQDPHPAMTHFARSDYLLKSHCQLDWWFLRLSFSVE